VLESADLQEAVTDDLRGLFPAVEQTDVENALDRIRENSTTIGIVAVVGTLWIGASFWGAMDTAFCRIYHVQCRGWFEQKRFALGMLFVVTLFLAASVIVPVAENALTTSASDLPFGIDEVGFLRTLALLAAALGATFAICCLIYYVVPKGHVPWRGVWPGAVFVTVTTAIANAAFPFYLTQSSIDRVGGALGFILVALLWFYFVALALMAGGVINALRYEYHDTGEVDEVGWRRTADFESVEPR
jgi:membrane protein